MTNRIQADETRRQITLFYPTRRLREYREMLSLLLDFKYSTLSLRSPASLKKLDQLIYGYETFANYRGENYGPLGRLLEQTLHAAYTNACVNIEAFGASRRFLRRCEREAIGLLRRSQNSIDRTPVLCTLMFYRPDLYGPHALILRTLIERHLLAGGSGTALVLAPRWFYDLLLGVWASACWGNSVDHEAADTAEESRRAGLSRAFPVKDVEVADIVALWDADPLQLYFDLDEVLNTIARV